jgi:phosphoenolpyruvate---glycerone phosphotransferase subunit DhaM
MIGIVLVSHSPALATAAVELASQMIPTGGPCIEVAAGVAGTLGTDATQVAEALARAATPDGVLVLMDLGSALLSAELAIELAALPDIEIRLSSAPMIEGLVAAVARAAGGADLQTVAREAENALAPKQQTLRRPRAEVPPTDGRPEPQESVTLTLINAAGLHARPAAQLASAFGLLEAEVVVESAGVRADGSSMLEILTLGAGKDCDITVSASGRDARLAVEAARSLVSQGFGEL